MLRGHSGRWCLALVFAVPFAVSCGTRHGTDAPRETKVQSQDNLDFDNPEAVLRAYLEAKTLERRISLVRNPAKVGPLMEETYAESFPRTTNYRITNKSEGSPSPIDPRPVCIMTVDFNDGGETGWYFLPKTEQGYRVDWMAFGYHDMPLKRFVVDHHEGPKKFRVLCSLENYYNYAFVNSARTHYCIRLHDRRGTVVHGYIARDHPDAKILVDGLVGADECLGIVELQRIGPRGEKLTDANGEHLTIKRLVSHTWVDWED